MKQKVLILFIMLLSSFQFAFAQPASIQRYTWIGGNKDGTKVALMLSHFGPSSQAPFANLIVKEVNKAEPLFTDGAWKMSGNEKDLEELCLNLIIKNKEKLETLGIELSNDFMSEANMVVSSSQDPHLISGWIDIENVSLNEFILKSYRATTCPNNSTGIAIEIWLNGEKRLISKPDPQSCWNDSFSLRNVFRTKKALWLILNMHAYGLNNVDTYWIDVQGVTF